ncbi:MAG: hypothetical protein RBR35_08065 [Salinivirgaceae bacterium]|nr:hypothetical protein [Salinivirgaceae bacterium]
MTTTSNNINSSITIEKIIESTQIVVSKYINRSVIPRREKEDVTMAIVEKFIHQKSKIDRSFEGKSKITTYYIAILNRMCCEVIRKESKHWYAVIEAEESYNQEKSTLAIETEKHTVIKCEVDRLLNTLTLLNNEKAKTILFLKYYFKIPIHNTELKEYCKEKTSEFSEILNQNNDLSKAELYENLAYLTNEIERKNIKGDAIRMWLNKQIDTIIERLNMHGSSFYNRESLAILIEHKDVISSNK